MGFLDKVKSAAGEVVKSTVNVATLGHADELEELVKSDEFVTVATAGQNKVVEGLKDEADKRKQAKRDERIAAAQLKETQEKLREVEFESKRQCSTPTCQTVLSSENRLTVVECVTSILRNVQAIVPVSLKRIISLRL